MAAARSLAICDTMKPKLLIETVNESWNSSISVTKTSPQPDYSTLSSALAPLELPYTAA